MLVLNADTSYFVAHTCIGISLLTEKKIEILHKSNLTISSAPLSNVYATRNLYFRVTDGHGCTERKKKKHTQQQIWVVLLFLTSNMHIAVIIHTIDTLHSIPSS